MNIEYSLSESFSYHGREFKLIENKTIGFISGASITLWNLQNNKKQFIWSERNGFQFFAVNHKRGVIAAAETGLNPKIFMYQYPKLNVILELSGLLPLEVLDLDISRDGSKLLIVSGVPNYEVILYDCHKKERIHGKSCSIPVKQKFLRARFNPANDNEFFMLYETALYIQRVLPAFELGPEQNLNKQARIESIQIPGLETLSLVAAVWDESNRIYLASTSNVALYSSEDQKVVVSKPLYAVASHFVLTQRHLIVCYSNNLIEWFFKFDSALNDEDRKPLAVDKYYTLQEGEVSTILYDHFMEELLVGTREGYVLMLPQPAEANVDDLDDDAAGDKTPSDDENQKEEKQLDIQSSKAGPFHTSEIIYMKELKDLDILVTVARDGMVFIWNLVEKSVIKAYHYHSETSKAQVSSDDRLLIMCSTQGCIRILEITDLANFQVRKIIRFFKNKEISSIGLNPEKTILAVSSSKSKKVFYVSISPDHDYKILGFSLLPDKVHSVFWLETPKHPIPTSSSVLLVLVNYLLIVVVAPNPNTKYPALKLELDQCPQYGRKVDPDLYLSAVDPNTGDILLTGKDKILKKYKQPDELIIKMDLRIKVPGSVPLEELDGHALPTNCLLIAPNNTICVSGGMDGTLFLRNLKNLATVTEIKAHNYKSQGVSALAFSSNSYLLYSGGKDGSLFIWELYPNEYRKGAEFATKGTGEYGVNELNAMDDAKVMFYKDVLEEEYNRTQVENRNKTKKQMKDAVLEIKTKLNQLLRNNKLADDLEKLARDDFVIDIETRDRILKDGEMKKMELRENAKKEVYKQELLHKRIKERTWDTMDVQLKAINGLRENYLVYNYNIRKRQPEELRRLKLIFEMRKQEIKEKLRREENNLKEVIVVLEIFKKPENYIINVVSGPPTLILNDYEIQEENLEKRKEAAAGGAGFKSGQVQAKKPGMKKPTQATKKEEEKAKEEEEKKKQEEALKQEATLLAQKAKKGPDDLADWDYFYGAFELFTNNRKRNQIYFIQNVIYKIKQEYNKEFEALVQFRLTQLENIHERRKRINEIILDLQREEELFEPKKNLLEDPNVVLKILDSEIKFEKYLSKEERDRREAERIKEEERIKARMADDSGQRALRDMMGGTLEEKKETALTETLLREEWMNKPVDEMSEEEKLKMREYEVKEQKMNEEKEKMRKNLENELKNLKNQIDDICFKFDEKLLVLFKRKLEYDQRIFEQELYIIRLVLSMIWQYKSSSVLKELETSKGQIEEKKKEYEEIQIRLEELKSEVENQKNQIQESFNNAFETKGRNDRNVEPTKIKNTYLLVFEDTKNDKKNKKKELELLEKPEYKKILIKLDPYLDIEKRELKKQRDEVFENYLDEINERIQNVDDENSKDFVLSQLANKFQLKKDLEKIENQSKDITSYTIYFDQDFNGIKETLAKNSKEYENATNFLTKNRSNIEIQIRMKQGLVEIPQEIPVPNLSEAILIPKSIIESRNKDIKKQGEKKIKAMEDIKEIKMNVKKAEYDLNLKNLIIKETELKTKEVQMLRVTKEMQIALSKQDTKMHNEYELKNLQDQIDKIRQTTEKRIAIYMKKEEKLEKDIQFIKKENEQLKLQGANLMATVKQRKEIHDMMFHKKAATAGAIGGGNKTLLMELNEKEKKEKDGYDNESFEKFQQIARNRKLFDEAKRQTEEIELLREELNKLKSKTFANFSNAKRSFI